MRTACAGTARRTGTSEDPVKSACVPRGRDDARARSTFLLQILLLVAMAAFIPEAGGERGAAFAVAAGVLFAVLAVL